MTTSSLTLPSLSEVFSCFLLIENIMQYILIILTSSLPSSSQIHPHPLPTQFCVPLTCGLPLVTFSELILLSQQLSTAKTVSARGGTSNLLSSPCWCFVWFELVRTYNFPAVPCSHSLPRALTIPPPTPSTVTPQTWEEGHVEMSSWRLNDLQSYALHLDQLWASVFITIYFKNEFLGWQ